MQCWIAEGKVTANGKTVTKAGTRVAADAVVQLSVKVAKFVSRSAPRLGSPTTLCCKARRVNSSVSL